MKEIKYKLPLSPNEYKRARFLARIEGHTSIQERVRQELESRVGLSDVPISCESLESVDLPLEPITLTVKQMNELAELKARGERLQVTITQAQAKQVTGKAKVVTISLSGELKVVARQLARASMDGNDSNQAVKRIVKWCALHQD